MAVGGGVWGQVVDGREEGKTRAQRAVPKRFHGVCGEAETAPRCLRGWGGFRWIPTNTGSGGQGRPKGTGVGCTDPGGASESKRLGSRSDFRFVFHGGIPLPNHERWYPPLVTSRLGAHLAGIPVPAVLAPRRRRRRGARRLVGPGGGRPGPSGVPPWGGGGDGGLRAMPQMAGDPHHCLGPRDARGGRLVPGRPSGCRPPCRRRGTRLAC